MAQPIKSVDERVTELLAEAPPLTDEQRELAVRMLAMPQPPVVTPAASKRREAPGRAA